MHHEYETKDPFGPIWAATALALPVVGAGLIGARQLLGVSTGIGIPELGPAVYWSLAFAGMLAGLIGARLVGDYVLSPRLLATRAAERDDVDISAPMDAARLQVGVHLLIQQAVLDAPACLLLVHSMVFDNDVSAALVIVNGVVGFFMLRPNMAKLVHATVLEMEHQRAG